MKRKYLVSIQGPTASGKTSMAIDVANWLQTEIISCDSRQFYKELKIGVAPPTKHELAQAKHHFIQHLSVLDSYNAGDFEKDAIRRLEEMHQHSDFAVLVGGSGLFADAILKGFDPLPTADEKVRAGIVNKFEKDGIEALQVELKAKDPEYYNQVDIQNPHRLIRALEIIEITGRPFSAQRTNHEISRPFTVISFAIDWPRHELYNRINKRVDMMVKAGLVDEVKSLKDYQHLQPLNTVGYKEVFGYLDGEHNLDRAIELIKRNSRRYAKRQLTWLRRNPDLVWVKPDELARVKEIVRKQSGIIDN